MAAIPTSAVKIPFPDDHNAEGCLFTLRTFDVRLPNEVARVECERFCHLVSWLFGHPQGLFDDFHFMLVAIFIHDVQLPLFDRVFHWAIDGQVRRFGPVPSQVLLGKVITNSSTTR